VLRRSGVRHQRAIYLRSAEPIPASGTRQKEMIQVVPEVRPCDGGRAHQRNQNLPPYRADALAQPDGCRGTVLGVMPPADLLSVFLGVAARVEMAFQRRTWGPNPVSSTVNKAAEPSLAVKQSVSEPA
jgi:hypothetical protein